jgi:YegS/Rv2252/BmrU family lipid kinase
MGARYREVRIVVNPAAGRDEPFLGALNRVLHPAGIRWDVRITNGPGEAADLARTAVAEGVDAVGVYGGDGTVAEVAEGLLGTHVPLAILPGGTGNGIAGELGIPKSLADAAGVLVDPSSRVQALDLGRAGEDVFLLRAATGAIADIDEKASREMKDRIGGLAYAVAGFGVLRTAQPVGYRVTMDGRTLEQDAVACIVANGAGFGGVGVLSEGISMSDGLFDVFLYTGESFRDLGAGLRRAPGILEARSLPTPPAGKGSHIVVESEVPQPVVADGEKAGTTPLEVSVIPAALDVLLPRSAPGRKVPEPARSGPREEGRRSL